MAKLPPTDKAKKLLVRKARRERLVKFREALADINASDRTRGAVPSDRKRGVDDSRPTYVEKHAGKLQTYRITNSNFSLHRTERMPDGTKRSVHYAAHGRSNGEGVRNEVALTAEGAAHFRHFGLIAVGAVVAKPVAAKSASERLDVDAIRSSYPDLDVASLLALASKIVEKPVTSEKAARRVIERFIAA